MNKILRSPLSLSSAFLVLVVAFSVVVGACSKKEDKPVFPAVRQGNTLTIAAKDLRIMDAVYYQENDGLYTVKASDAGKKLAAVRIQVYNGRSELVKMNVDENGYTLLDKASKEYVSVNPFGERRRLEPNLPAGSELWQFIWRDFEIPKGNSIEAWTIFEIPATVQPNQIRWNAVETVFVPFYPIEAPKT